MTYNDLLSNYKKQRDILVAQLETLKNETSTAMYKMYINDKAVQAMCTFDGKHNFSVRYTDSKPTDESTIISTCETFGKTKKKIWYLIPFDDMLATPLQIDAALRQAHDFYEACYKSGENKRATDKAVKASRIAELRDLITEALKNDEDYTELLLELKQLSK